MNKPYLSIVLCGRNDNYGGDFKLRLQRCIEWNFNHLEQSEINSEIIFVNYNPLPLPEIEKFIDWPKSGKFVKIKVITVPENIHIDFMERNDVNKVPLLEYPAKNVGIRRAIGEFILCINPDILLPKSILKFISSKTMSKHAYYRANRLDFNIENRELTEENFFNTAQTVNLKGFPYNFSKNTNKKLEYYLFQRINNIRLKYEHLKLKYFKISNFLKLPVTYDNAPFLAHCLCSGDFLMMHSENWLKLGGYPGNTFTSLHTDALFVIMCYANYYEVIFDAPIFHQEHERRYNCKTDEEDVLHTRVYRIFEKNAKKILNNESIEFVNSDNWGFIDIELEQKYF